MESCYSDPNLGEAKGENIHRVNWTSSRSRGFPFACSYHGQRLLHELGYRVIAYRKYGIIFEQLG